MVATWLKLRLWHRAYFVYASILKMAMQKEKALAAKLDELWKEVDFNWYRNGQNVLYWHWSPNNAWKMNFPVHGYNECLIMYVLAASSPTHGVPAEVYHEGWAENGKIKNAGKHIWLSRCNWITRAMIRKWRPVILGALFLPGFRSSWFKRPIC